MSMPAVGGQSQSALPRLRRGGICSKARRGCPQWISQQTTFPEDGQHGPEVLESLSPDRWLELTLPCQAS